MSKATNRGTRPRDAHGWMRWVEEELRRHDWRIRSVGAVTGTGTGGPPTGPAGGDLAGSYPDPEIRAGAVGTPELADGAVTSLKIADGTITAGDLSAALAAAIAAVALDVQDENGLVLADTAVMDFQGTGVVVTTGGAGEVVVTIPGAGVATAFIGAKMRNTAAQSIPTNSATALVFNTTDYNLGGGLTLNQGAGTITVDADGVYGFGAGVILDANSITGRRICSLAVNGALVARSEVGQHAAGISPTFSLTHEMWLAAGSVITAPVFHTLGSSFNTGTTVPAHLWCSARHLGPAA